MEIWKEAFRWKSDEKPETTHAVVMVSNTGRVKKLPYRRWNKNNKGYSNISGLEYAYLTNRGKQRHEQEDNGNGKYINVCINKKSYAVHRLVAIAFIPNPEGKPQVNHIDEDRSNNNSSNLEWVTNLENQQRKSEEAVDRIRNKLSLLSEGQIKEALRLRLSGKTTKEIGVLFGVSLETIRASTSDIATDEEKMKIKILMKNLARDRRLKTMNNKKKKK